MSASLTVAIEQTAGAPMAVEANLRALPAAAARATALGAELLILPELWLSGYNIGDGLHEVAEERDGPAAAEVARIAAEHDLAILYGYPERDGRALYNAAQLIDGSGTPLTNFRKVHLYGRTERHYFDAGDDLCSVVAVGGVRIGVLVCYDVEFPEAVRTACLHGAELVAVPTAMMTPYRNVAEQVVPARAYENQVFVAYANRCGTEYELTYPGGSCICAPDGSDLARAGEGPATIAATLDTAWRGDAADFAFLQDRRPDCYRDGTP